MKPNLLDLPILRLRSVSFIHTSHSNHGVDSSLIIIASLSQLCKLNAISVLVCTNLEVIHSIKETGLKEFVLIKKFVQMEVNISDLRSDKGLIIITSYISYRVTFSPIIH